MIDAETNFKEFDRSWRAFLQTVVLAKNHNGLSRLESPFLPRDPIADSILPTLLYVQLASLLDDGLRLHLEQSKGKALAKRLNLAALIDLAKSDLIDPDAPDSIRKSRNPLAHEPGEFASWQDLDSAIASAYEELRGLNLVNDRPDYKFFSERSGAEACDDPGIAFKQEYKFGLKVDGEVVLGLSWTSQVARASAS